MTTEPRLYGQPDNLTSDNVSVAVIGCGYWGRNLVRNMRDLGALAMVCDATEAGRQLARQLAPKAQVTESISEVLASSVDGVLVATPAETHHDLTIQALRAGKHVFCEKPLNLPAGPFEMVDEADRCKRTLMRGHVLEYHPAIACLRELVEDGELGKDPIHLSPIGLAWATVVRRMRYGVSLLTTSQSSFACWGNCPSQVVACGGSYLQPNIADVTVTQLLFDNGVRAHVFVSRLHPFKEQRLVVVGSRRMASFNDVDKELTLYDQYVDYTASRSLSRARGSYAPDEPLSLEASAYLHAISSGEEPLTVGQSGQARPQGATGSTAPRHERRCRQPAHRGADMSDHFPGPPLPP